MGKGMGRWKRGGGLVEGKEVGRWGDRGWRGGDKEHKLVNVVL